MHDEGFLRAERIGDITKTQANRDLANSLRGSFRTNNALGSTAQVYRAGEFLIFEALARYGER